MSKRQHSARYSGSRKQTGKGSAASGKPGRPTPSAAPDRVMLYGFHAVEAALRNDSRRLYQLSATARAAERLASLLNTRGLAPTLVSAADLTRRLGEGTVHQGLLLEAAPLHTVALEDLAPASPLIVLDQVTDPHNVGAILRTAAAYGAGAVIGQDRHAPAPSGALAKAATGALEHVPYLQVTNISRALEQLKRDGYWIIGLDGDGPATIEESVGRRPVALVLGAEGAGLRRLTQERCDLLARLDLPGPIKTLNVSNAAAIALYAVHRTNMSISE